MEIVEEGVRESSLNKEDEKSHLFPRLTIKWLKDHCRKHGLYQTPYLNEVLYLQYQGFKCIESLEEYTNLRSLWLDHNHLTEIGTGLFQMKTTLKCLFLQNNCLTNLDGIDELQELVILDVSHNQIRRTSPLENLPNLSTLYIGHNKLDDAIEADCIQSLKLCPSLNTLDISRNKLSDAHKVMDVLKHITELRVLYLHGNPVVREIDPYRTQLILQCENLTFLDDRPIRENDRACAKAWYHGGLKAMEGEKQRQKDEEQKELMRNVEGVLKRFCSNKNQSNEVAQISEETNGKDSCSTVDLSDVILEFSTEE